MKGAYVLDRFQAARPSAIDAYRRPFETPTIMWSVESGPGVLSASRIEGGERAIKSIGVIFPDINIVDGIYLKYMR